MAIRLPTTRSDRWPNLSILPSFACLEEAVIVLFCLIDDAYALFDPRPRGYESLKRLSDSEIITLALLQQLRGVQTFLRDAQRFFLHLFPGVVGFYLLIAAETFRGDITAGNPRSAGSSPRVR